MSTPARFKKSSKKFTTKLEDADFDRFKRKTGLSQAEIVKLKELFDIYDYEQRGCINPKHLQQALSEMAADQSHTSVYGYLYERLGKVGDDMVFEQLIDLVGATSTLKDTKDSVEKVKSRDISTQKPSNTKQMITDNYSFWVDFQNV
mmetsp:Transcript_47052/g.54234  ORF Transcript_47052/g.54234 Transcript_47052/m.54234 type:complete len:147 (+) Transcript_47052:186-626(+)